MALITVSYDDTFDYTFREVDLKEWWAYVSVRLCTPEQLTELRRLQVEYDKFQALLKELHDGPNVNLGPMGPEDE